MNLKESLGYLPKTEWYVDTRYDDIFDTTYKLSKLNLGQIEAALFCISEYVKRKEYRNADRIRNKLVEIGYTWVYPKTVNTGNLLGHTKKKLTFKKNRDCVSIEGYIHESATKPAKTSKFYYEFPI